MRYLPTISCTDGSDTPPPWIDQYTTTLCQIVRAGSI
jgi:hypothetical protein